LLLSDVFFQASKCTITRFMADPDGELTALPTRSPSWLRTGTLTHHTIPLDVFGVSILRPVQTKLLAMPMIGPCMDR